jgi:hypothetical protein
MLRKKIMTNDKFIQVCQVEGFISWIDSAKVSLTKARHVGVGLMINIEVEDGRIILLGAISLTLADALTPHQIVAMIQSMYDAFMNGQQAGKRIGKTSMQNSLRELLGFSSMASE